MMMGDAIQIRGDDTAAWNVMRQRAETLLKSGFLPKAIRTPEQALAVMQTGQELGLGPMQALRSIHVIEGKPALAAELMAALAFRHVPGCTLRVAVSSNHECEVHAARPGNPVTIFKFTIQDAQVAGVASKDVWRKYPRAMLRSRCVSEAVRAIFPDASMGLYTPEELGSEVEVAELAPANLEPEQPTDVVVAPPKELPAKTAEPFRFKSGERQGELITEVPTEYLQRLGKHPLRADMKRRVDAELERRDKDPGYLAERLQASIDARKKLDDDIGDLPPDWGGVQTPERSECPECQDFVKDCPLCLGTGRPTGVQK